MNLRLIKTMALIGIMFFSYSSQAWWWSKPSTYTQTKYPIVLTHGLYGFDNLLDPIIICNDAT